jgi:hypothetical protein
MVRGEVGRLRCANVDHRRPRFPSNSGSVGKSYCGNGRIRGIEVERAARRQPRNPAVVDLDTAAVWRGFFRCVHETMHFQDIPKTRRAFAPRVGGASAANERSTDLICECAIGLAASQGNVGIK